MHYFLLAFMEIKAYLTEQRAPGTSFVSCNFLCNSFKLESLGVVFITEKKRKYNQFKL